MAHENINVTLRQLQALVNVAEFGSFVAASRAMYVTASAISILIAELELALGFRVLDRTTRQVKLSAAGEEYFRHARLVLLELDGAHRCAIDVRSQKTGVVRLAMSQVIAWTLAPPILQAFREFRPDVIVEPMEMAVDEVLASLDAGRADLAITLRGSAGDSLLESPAFGSRVHLVCSQEHRWASRKRLSWAEIQGEQLIFTGAETPQRINAALPKGPILNAARRAEHTGTALALVASGYGCAICAGYVRPMVAMHRLRMIPLVEPSVVRQFSIYTARRRALLPAIEGFRDFMANWFVRTEDGLVEHLP